MADLVKSHGALVAATFAGDSLNQNPAAPDNYPTVMLSTRTNVRRYNVYRAGFPIVSLSSIATCLADLDRSAKAGTKSVLIMVVGVNDIAFGLSAATIYAAMKTYADAWRTKATTGDDVTPYVIGTTVTPSSTFTAPQETVRTTLNTSILTNADSRFDSVVNLAAGTLLGDAANTTDGTHWSVGQASEAAGLIGPAFDLLVA